MREAYEVALFSVSDMTGTGPMTGKQDTVATENKIKASIVLREWETGRRFV